MAEQDFTTSGDKETQIKIEAFAAIQRAKEILDSLAALTLLRMKAAEGGGSDLSPSFWRELYKDSPWGINPGETPQILPEGLEVALNEMIFKQLGAAWQELDGKAERGFGPDFVLNVWNKRHQQGEEKEEGE
jgi:hypothetical protein